MTSATDELRIVVIYRSDLDMPRGKSEVQFGHAVANLVHAQSTGDEESILGRYMRGSQLKLSMEVADLDSLFAIRAKANDREIPLTTVVDAGRTVFGEPTITCIGLGPMGKTDCNALTRKARMRE